MHDDHHHTKPDPTKKMRAPSPAMIKVVSISAVLIIGVVSFIMVRSHRNEVARTKLATTGWYYDTTTKELFSEDHAGQASFRRESGSEAVTARMFAKGDPLDEANRFLGYYERYKPSTEKKLDGNPDIGIVAHYMNRVGSILQVSKDGANWVDKTSDAGRKVMRVVSPDGSENPTPINP